jgi:hypothetical protein
VQVRTGWSGEIESNVWRKIDVELDVTDLDKLLTEHGFPQTLAGRLPVSIGFELLQGEGEILMLRKLITLGYPQDKALARIGELATTQAALLSAVREKLQLDGAAA